MLLSFDSFAIIFIMRFTIININFYTDNNNKEKPLKACCPLRVSQISCLKTVIASTIMF